MLAQQAQPSAPAIIRPPSNDPTPPPIGNLGMSSAVKMDAPAPPKIALPAGTERITPQIKSLAASESEPAPKMATPQMGGGMPKISAPTDTTTVNRLPTQTDILKTEQARKENTGSGISQIASKIEGTKFGQDHPFLGKLSGGLLQGLATLGDVGLRAVAPAVDLALPGTSLHHLADLHSGNKQIAANEAAQESEAQQGAHRSMAAHEDAETAGLSRAQQDTHDVSQATIGNLKSEADHRGDQKDAWKELAGYSGPHGEPLEINEATGETRAAGAPTGSQKNAPTKENTPAQQTYDALLKQGFTPQQAYEKIREKPGGTVINQGTWTIDEDAQGHPVLFNSKTGETKAAPPGVAKAGTFAKNQAKDQPAKQALDYADSYIHGIHTGPGDEALMEKFFELAKPSTGFRMSQPQIDMLKNAQGWTNSLEAKFRHATTGTWFSDEQRNQIAGTMKDLAKAKGIDTGETPTAPQTAAPAGADNEVYVGGKLVGHTVKGVYVPLGSK